MMLRIAIVAAFLVLALLYVGSALRPDHVLVPMDIPTDLLAWKGDPAVRVRVSNSLLSDVPLQKVPWDLEARRLIQQGDMPWRNQFAGDEAHLFANPQAGLLSPFTWPRLALGLRGWPWSVLLKLLIGALAMFWLARVVGASPLGSFLSGAFFTLSGYAVVWALFPHTNVFVLLPAVAAAAILLSREVTPWRVIALGLLSALATAGGHYEGLFVGITAIAIWLILSAGPRWFAVALTALTGFLLLGIQLVPFATLLRQSYVLVSRGEQLGSFFRKFSLVSVFLPGYLGSPLKGELDLSGVFSGIENFNQRNGAFFGALALLAIAFSWRQLTRPMRVGVLIGVAAFIVSLSPPILTVAIRSVPIVGGTAAEYYAIAFVLFGSLVAGPSVENLLRTGVRRKLAVALLLTGSMVVVGGALPLLAPAALQGAARRMIDTLRTRGHLQQAPEVYEQRLAAYLDAARWTALRRVAVPGLCWALFGAALLIPPGRSRVAIGSLAAVAELVAFGWGYNPAIPTSAVAREPAMLREVMTRDPERQWLIASSNEVFPPNLSTLWRVRDVHAYDILASRRKVDQLRPAGYEPLRWGLPSTPSDAQLRTLGSLGVRFYLTGQGLIEIPDAVMPALPSNHRPDGLVPGLILSIAATLLLTLLTFVARRADAS